MSAVQTEYIDTGEPTAETLSWLLLLPLIDHTIIHWELNKIVDICQTIFWSAVFAFWFTFHNASENFIYTQQYHQTKSLNKSLDKQTVFDNYT